MNSASPVANFADYKRNLADLYTRLLYNKVVCLRLMSQAARLEKAVRSSVLVLLGISLLTGAFPVLNGRRFSGIWAFVTITATLLTLYSLIVGSGEKQFRWFRLAAHFQTCASEVEFFAFYVKQGKVLEPEFAERWRAFSTTLNQLVESAGPEFIDYAEKNKHTLTEATVQLIAEQKSNMFP
jgi:hypothetical protein